MTNTQIQIAMSLNLEERLALYDSLPSVPFCGVKVTDARWVYAIEIVNQHYWNDTLLARVTYDVSRGVDKWDEHFVNAIRAIEFERMLEGELYG
jgi:hypothetical protein